MRKKAVQKGRSERSGEYVLLPYGELLNDARTPLADFFRILLSDGSDIQGLLGIGLLAGIPSPCDFS
ncbi:MAG: hypothetical protein K0S58_3359 [Nitrospira sp.]|jgi:hypothetical protein|nr:hypothetical protein [Nitrospira sp.]